MKNDEQDSAYDALSREPMDIPMNGGDGGVDTGYDRALNILTVTEDDPLELMTRTTPILAKACAISYSMTATFRSSYVYGRINQIERLSVSLGGKGREEIVRSLSANAGAFSGESGGESSTPFMPAPED
ncbi:MAG: hypothetical protein IIY21_04235 [Clostridiales bacterium]|nr:hypothetical protein [Clostridiales bacterium]MBQ1573906.1 hypothetical protein [Clostridiales bacterium]